MIDHGADIHAEEEEMLRIAVESNCEGLLRYLVNIGSYMRQMMKR